MAENYLEYGKCKACKVSTIFRYQSTQPAINGLAEVDLYDCLKCHGTFELSNLEKTVRII